MKIVENFIVKFLKRFKKKIIEQFDPEDILAKKNEQGFEIFLTGINDDNNVRLLNIDGQLEVRSDDDDDVDVDVDLYKKYYIVSKDYFVNYDPETFMTFLYNENKGGWLTVVNHHWSYDFSFPPKTAHKMYTLFINAVKRDRKKMETVCNKNVTTSLSIIIKEFQERQKNSANILVDEVK
jgi:hypothetical protein